MIRWVNGQAVNMTGQEIAEVNRVKSALASSPTPRSLLKTTIYQRGTDAELEAFEAWLQNGATLRQRLMWTDSVEIDANDPQVRAVMTALFGRNRMLELLA